ncbi:MAG: hypothetical protein NZ954_04020 [Thermofilaceae archaeon]|nr:hypothetical protein [Thermofilaceae archaeon]MCX8180819.1 hypothetical protein [Thermofilaceae archaeon]MDW8004605.1 hypothetical protein [Thermofilaceae archaeon]
MVETVVETRGGAGLDKLESLARRANDLKANLNALLHAIETKYLHDPRFSSLVRSVLRTVQPPEPPSEQLFLVSSSLEKYVNALEHSVKTLTEYAVALDRLYEELDKLNRELSELSAWGELLKEVAPHLASEAQKLQASAQKLLSQPPLEDPKRSLDEVDLILKDIRSHMRVCKTAYVNRVNELLLTTSQLARMVKRASRSSLLTETSKFLSYEESLRKLEEKLNRAAKQPIETMLNLSQVKAELDRIESELSQLTDLDANSEEEMVIREIDRLAHAFENRAVNLSLVIETISKRTSLPIEKVLYQLYLMEKRKVVSIYVKLEA